MQTHAWRTLAELLHAHTRAHDIRAQPVDIISALTVRGFLRRTKHRDTRTQSVEPDYA